MGRAVSKGKFKVSKAKARAKALHAAGKISKARRDAIMSRPDDADSPPMLGNMPAPPTGDTAAGVGAISDGGPESGDY